VSGGVADGAGEGAGAGAGVGCWPFAATNRARHAKAARVNLSVARFI
jgi:hypothetical protein